MIRRIWNPVDRVETETYHDLTGDLIEILYGFCEVHYHLDEQVRSYSGYSYNKQREIVVEPYQFS